MDSFIFFAEGNLLIVDDLKKEASKRGLVRGPSPWWSQPDLLIDTNGRLAGFFFCLQEDMSVKASHIVESVKFAQSVRLFGKSEAIKREIYKGVQGPVMEILRPAIMPSKQIVAQLDDDWFYVLGKNADNAIPSAWGYSGIDDALAPLMISI